MKLQKQIDFISCSPPNCHSETQKLFKRKTTSASYALHSRELQVNLIEKWSDSIL